MYGSFLQFFDFLQLFDRVPEPWRTVLIVFVATGLSIVIVLGAAKRAGLFDWKVLPPPSQTLPAASGPSSAPAQQQGLSPRQLIENVKAGKIDFETAKSLFAMVRKNLNVEEPSKAEAAFISTVQTIGAAPRGGEQDALVALAEGKTEHALNLLDTKTSSTSAEALRTFAAIATPANPGLAVQKFSQLASATESRPLAKDQITLSYRLPKFPDVTIGIVTGNIADIKFADAWVNSENDWLTMARVVDRSISATIRFYSSRRDARSADKEIDQLPLNDPMQKALKPWPYGRVKPLELGAVRITRSWELKKRNNVKRILHVVSVKVRPLRGPELGPNPENYIRDVMRRAENHNQGLFVGGSKLKTMVVPLFGTGMAGNAVDDLTDRFVEGLLQGAAAISAKGKPPTLKEIRLLAFSTREFVPLRNSFDKRVKVGDLVQV